jgi:hypothetical protein
MWLLKAAIFFTLFAFALNNQQMVAVHFFLAPSGKRLWCWLFWLHSLAGWHWAYL